jgi:hypothetical protein
MNDRNVKQAVEILCTHVNGKMRPTEIFQEWGKMIEGMNSTMIYCKNFCKCHIVPLVQQ